MKQRKGTLAILALAMLALISTLPLHAQEVANLTGTVTDTTGAVIPGVGLTLVNTRTNTTYQTTTTGAGVYTFAKLVPGPGYKLTVKKDGFESIIINDLYLTVSTTRTEDIKMKVGQLTESVEVSAQGEAVTLNTTDATVGNNFNIAAVQQLPVQVRDSPSTLLQLQPGVVTATGGSDGLSSRAGAVTGARGDQNNITLDGLDVNDFATGQAFSTVANAPVDSIQEFRGETAGSLAAEGRGSGGQIKMVTVGGTNTFHGGAWDYHRDNALAANSWFNNNRATPLAKPKLIRNQFGAKIGGPIFRDKLFFFFNYNGRRESQAATALTIVPLDSFRNGTVSYIKRFDPNGATCGAASRQNTTPQCIGTLNASQIAALDPQHVGSDAALLSFINGRYPHANDLTAGDGINTGGYRFNSPVNRTSNDYVARVDYNMIDSMKLFGRFSILRDRYGDSVNYAAPVVFDGDPLTKTIENTSYAFVIGHTWTISPTVVNQFTYGKTVSRLAFPTSFNPTGTNYWTFGGGASVAWTNPYYNQSSQARVNPIPVFRDDLTWQKGAHQIQFGGMFKPIKTNSFLGSDNNFPRLGLGGRTTALNAGLRPADIRPNSSTASTTYDSAFTMMLGRIASIDSNYNYNSSLTPLAQGSGATREYRYYETEAYLQDTWKATPSLTLTYGLRYQYYSVPYEVNGIEAIPNIGFDELLQTRQALGVQGVSGDSVLPITTYDLAGKGNNARGLYKANTLNFAPRVSFAYTPSSDGWAKRFFGNKEMVIRGGGGIVYDHPVTNALNFIQDQNSYMFQSATTIQYGASTPAAALLNDPRFTSITTIPTPTPAPAIDRPYAPFVDTTGVPYGLADNQFNYAIDPNLKTPYSIVFNLGIQRELPAHFLVEATYVGRLGRRLIAQADASQLVDFRDPTSGQLMSAAFAGLTQAVKAGQFDNAGNYIGPSQPWLENQSFPGASAYLAENLSSLIQIGDVADTMQFLAANGVLASNVGLASQFAGNTYITNKGSSNYHGLLASVHRNFASGLQFDLNYTFSHSIDNASGIANSISSSTGIGFICDALNLRTCRGNSDFDVKHIVSGDFIYELPFGKGKQFGGDAPGWANQLIGGWTLSGIPVWRSGFAFSSLTGAYLMGYANNSPGIFIGNQNDLKVGVHKIDSTGTVNLFADPGAAIAAFDTPEGLNIGSRNNLRGPSYFNVDFGLQKKFPITERWNVSLRADAFNAFNHASFGLPGGGGNGAGAVLTNGEGQFGKITTTSSTARVVQVSARIDF